MILACQILTNRNFKLLTVYIMIFLSFYYFIQNCSQLPQEYCTDAWKMNNFESGFINTRRIVSSRIRYNNNILRDIHYFDSAFYGINTQHTYTYDLENNSLCLTV